MEMKDAALDPSQKEIMFNDWRRQIYAHPEGGEKLNDVYNGWAQDYTEQCMLMGYYGPANVAKIVSELLDDKSSRILDVASGTGMAGEELKRCGFTNIDALDPSQNSLDVSKKHQSYTQYICDTVGEHQTNIPNDSYDALIMCGAFGVPGHLTVTCFPELIRITKPGGYILFTISIKVLEEWKDKLEGAIQANTLQGLWELVEYRWIQYHDHTSLYEKAKVPILRVL